MPKTKSITTDKGKLVNHEELRALVAHISAKFTALEARVEECERTRPVDPAVKEAGDALIADIRNQTGHMERALMLMPDKPKAPSDAFGLGHIEEIRAKEDQIVYDIGDALALIPNELDPEVVSLHNRVELDGEGDR